MHNLGQTRSVRRSSHILQTPDTFIRTQLPGSEKTAVVVHVSPALGAAFTQYTAEFEPDGVLGAAVGQRFVYVLDGQVEVEAGGETRNLCKDGYIYIPDGMPHACRSANGARAAVIEKRYAGIAGVKPPTLLMGRELEAAGQPLMGDPDLLVRGLLPDNVAFDFAVNTMTYQPGATLSMVEIHVMEHGLLMLEGGGIYKLDESWYPVTAGDFIWMAAYCPQWFGALGKAPAKYLIYKDWNRHPLG
ncbi:MAG TPA: (S)-ureidoglycine aminohydrolase [Acidobacteriaceae bacterium]|nr:(S)-ureidoglycine aminohydrolase [Acidobacteriaceae bacterium]